MQKRANARLRVNLILKPYYGLLLRLEASAHATLLILCWLQIFPPVAASQVWHGFAQRCAAFTRLAHRAFRPAVLRLVHLRPQTLPRPL